MKKYAFFKVGEDFLYEQMKEYNCEVLDVYRKIPKLFKTIRKLHYQLKLPFFEIWFNKVPEEITDCECCIVCASNHTPRFIDLLTQRTKARIIFWYNSPISYYGFPHRSIIDYNQVIISSFDQRDCYVNNFFYNSQYYFRKIELPQCEIEYDVLFIGKDKGRLKSILRLEKYFKGLGLRTCFYICSSDADINESKTNHTYKPYLSYDQVLGYIAKTKIIVDITHSIQYGLSLGPLESIFFEKKLITNNRNIMKERFYHPNNIAVIDIEYPKINIDFFEKPYEKLSESIVNYYDFESWLDRFPKIKTVSSHSEETTTERESLSEG